MTFTSLPETVLLRVAHCSFVGYPGLPGTFRQGLWVRMLAEQTNNDIRRADIMRCAQITIESNLSIVYIRKISGQVGTSDFRYVLVTVSIKTPLRTVLLVLCQRSTKDSKFLRVRNYSSISLQTFHVLWVRPGNATGDCSDSF